MNTLRDFLAARTEVATYSVSHGVDLRIEAMAILKAGLDSVEVSALHRELAQLVASLDRHGRVERITRGGTVTLEVSL